MSKMKAYVLHGKEDLRFEADRPAPGISDDDVLIRVRRSGICGSDIHYFREGYIGKFIPRAPFVLGHEFCGVVEEAGPASGGFRAGDRVTVEPSISCGECRYCRSGRYNLCVNMRFFGSASCFPHIDGGFGELVAAPARNVVPLPDSLDDAEGALVEPLAVALHALLRAQAAAGPGGLVGRRLLVTGGGTIGQCVLLTSRALGCAHAALSDIDSFSRRFALEAGADLVLDPAAPESRDQALKFAPMGFDLVIEASGSPAALSQALELAGRGSTIVQIGTQPAEATLPINLVMSKEINLIGSFRYAHVFQAVVDLIAAGQIDARPLVTHVFPFEKLPEAMRTAVAKEDVIKVQIALS